MSQNSNDLQDYAIDLIERDLIVAAAAELGCPGAFMRFHLLGVFQQTAVE